MNTQLFLILYVLSFSFTYIAGNRAPDTAPNLPEGWCDLRYGRPTATTGECICMTQNCEGKACERSQGNYILVSLFLYLSVSSLVSSSYLL